MWYGRKISTQQLFDVDKSSVDLKRLLWCMQRNYTLFIRNTFIRNSKLKNSTIFRKFKELTRLGWKAKDNFFKNKIQLSKFMQLTSVCNLCCPSHFPKNSIFFKKKKQICLRNYSSDIFDDKKRYEELSVSFCQIIEELQPLVKLKLP